MSLICDWCGGEIVGEPGVINEANPTGLLLAPDDPAAEEIFFDGDYYRCDTCGLNWRVSADGEEDGGAWISEQDCPACGQPDDCLPDCPCKRVTELEAAAATLVPAPLVTAPSTESTLVPATLVPSSQYRAISISFALGFALAALLCTLVWHFHECKREVIALRATAAAERWQATANAQWLRREDMVQMDEAAERCRALERTIVKDRRAIGAR